MRMMGPRTARMNAARCSVIAGSFHTPGKFLATGEANPKQVSAEPDQEYRPKAEDIPQADKLESVHQKEDSESDQENGPDRDPPGNAGRSSSRPRQRQ